MAVKILNGIDVYGSMNIAASDVPNLDASKITSGTFSIDRIPNLSSVYQPLGDYLTSETAGTIFQPLGNYLTSVPAEYLTQTEGDARYLQSLPSHNHDTLYDAIGSAAAVQNFVNEQNFATDAAISTAVSNYLPLSGGTLSGNLTVGAVGKTSDTVVRSLADQSYKAGFEAYGNGQGTGYFYAGQSLDYGGGFSYNGDNSPGFISGETADNITFFRRQAGANTEVFYYAYSNNDVYFNGAVVASGSNSNNWNTAYGWGNHASAGYLTSIPSSYATDAEVNSAVSVVNDRIDTEILPSIPTNNNQLTNGAGYLTTSGKAADSNLLDGIDSSGFVRAYGTSNDNIDADWGQSFKTFDPIPGGTPPIQSPNLRTINVGNDFNRRTQLAFNYSTDQAWFRRKDSSGWGEWREFYHTGNLSLSTLGYTGATNANYITNNNQLTNGAGYATTSYVNTAVANIVDTAPAALNTLNELAAALGDDANFSTTVSNNIGAINTRIDTEVLPAIEAKQNAGNYFTDGDTVLNMANNDGLVYDDTTNKMYLKLDGTNREIYHTGNFTDSSANWNTAYGWGNHASAGYLTTLGFSYGTGITANHVVQRDAYGYIYANHINFNTTETENPTINSFFVSNGDGWSRKASVAHVKSQLGLGSAAYVATSTFDAAGAADAVNTRIDEDVLPAIPTNNNQLTNGAGYLTSLPNNAATFTNNIYLGNSDTTANFISQLTDLGAFQENYKSFKVAWDYAGNSNLDVGFESVELAGCLIECWGGTYKHVRLTRPTTGTGGRSIYVYNDQGSGYSPGWRQIWTSDEFSSTNVSNWNTAYGWGNHGSVGYATQTWVGEQNYASDAAISTAIATVTLASLGYTGATNANYITNNNQLTNGAGYTSNTGTITGVSTGAGLDGVASSGDVTITLDLSELTDMTAAVDPTVDEIILLDNGAERRKLFSEIFGSAAYQNTSAFDSAGSAAAVNDRIDTDVLPAIGAVTLSSLGFTGATNANYITNNNQLTNGAGYLTSIPSSYATDAEVATAAATAQANAIAHADTKIETEVLPSIPTNNNQLTNGAGYVTSSHTHTPSQVGLSNLSANGNSLTGNFTATGDITAFSDARVKENIETLPNALEAVKQMRGVTYNKIGEEKQSIGVIAQELEEVVPQLVHTDEEGMKSVAYGNITALLIEALKEQQEQIEELKAKLNGLTK